MVREIRCPECGSETTLRTSKKDGSKFYVCVNYPECKGRVAYDDEWEGDWEKERPAVRVRTGTRPKAEKSPKKQLRIRFNIRKPHWTWIFFLFVLCIGIGIIAYTTYRILHNNQIDFIAGISIIAVTTFVILCNITVLSKWYRKIGTRRITFTIIPLALIMFVMLAYINVAPFSTWKTDIVNAFNKLNNSSTLTPGSSNDMKVTKVMVTSTATLGMAAFVNQEPWVQIISNSISTFNYHGNYVFIIKYEATQNAEASVSYSITLHPNYAGMSTLSCIVEFSPIEISQQSTEAVWRSCSDLEGQTLIEAHPGDTTSPLIAYSFTNDIKGLYSISCQKLGQ